jgi:NADH-quinone oxidoreductase subunit N
MYSLTMFSVGGMMLFVSAQNLIVMFIALEVLSLPLYLLCGLARRHRLLSQESAVKYFLLGAYSSAFFLYGVALLYGYAGSVSLTALHDAAVTPGSNDALLYAGLALLGVGLLFKVGAVPFHFWTPDVYQGAPTAVTALMAACTKVAGFGALLRVLLVPFYDLRAEWRPSVGAVAVLTMVVGAVIAVTQTDVKRMLAYSSVAHAGFILTGVAATNRAGLSGAMFYLLAYGFTVIGAFALLTLVRDANGEATHLSQWQGLGRRSPLIAGLFTFFLFALAGIPLTSGFVGKFAVFSAAVRGGATYLAIVGVVTSAVAAFFYARVVVLMFFQEPVEGGAEVVAAPVFTAAAVGLAAIVILFAVAVPAFGVKIYANTLPAAVVTLLLGAVCLCALGVAVASLVRNADQAMPVAQLTFLPISFISGIWFPLDGAPDWLLKIAHFFPVYHLVNSFDGCFVPGVANNGWKPDDLLALVIWTAVGLFVAARRFRFEPGAEGESRGLRARLAG